MERVQHQLESSLPELKDLQAKGIFSPQEIKLIIKRRTDYEIQLVRRQPRKKDFLEYIEYEMTLEKLRKKRLERLKSPVTHSVSSYSLIQHQFSLFERATRKFKSDVRLWVQYITTAQRAGANTIVSRALAKALKLHPTTILFYTLAAQHELNQGSPSAARNILQRGIRLNPENVEIWDAYVKMELGWVEMLRRRWERLGIAIAVDTTASTTPVAHASNDGPNEVDGPTSDLMGDAETLEISGNQSQIARRRILQGAIVKEVIEDAMKATPSLSTFHTLHETLRTYPTQLARSVTPFLYKSLESSIKASASTKSSITAGQRAEARVVYAKRHLEPNHEATKTKLQSDGSEGFGKFTGTALIDGIKATNEELLQHIHNLDRESSLTGEIEEMYSAYALFVSSQWDSLRDDHLKLYLLSSLHNLCSQILRDNKPGTSGVDSGHAVFATHIRLLLSLSLSSLPQPQFQTHCTPEKTLKLARKYTTQCSDCEVWLARLQAEKQPLKSKQKEGVNGLKVLAAQARKACTSKATAVEGTREDNFQSLEKLWSFGWDTSSFDEREDLLKETLSLPISRQTAKLREVIFIRLLSDIYSPDAGFNSTSNPGISTGADLRRFSIIPRLLKNYFPSPEVYKHAFHLEASSTSSLVEKDSKRSKDLVETIFRQWRDSKPNSNTNDNATCREEATFAWCTYLLGLGGTNVKEATTVMSNYLAGMDLGEKTRAEVKWRKVLDGGVEQPEMETAEDEDNRDEDVEMDGGEHDDAEESEEDEDVEFVVVG